MSCKTKIDKTMPQPRNAMAVIARTKFRSVKFDHKAEERGGDSNEFVELLEEYLNWED